MSFLNGTGSFFEDADAAIKAWLVGPHVGGDALQTVSDGLNALNPVIRDHESATEEKMLQESVSNHPLIYIFTGIFAPVEAEAKTLTLNCTTSFQIFTDHVNAKEAVREATAVAVLVTGIMKLTGRGGATGFAWSDTFSNYYTDPLIGVTNSYPTTLKDTTRVATSLSMTWQHEEGI